MVAVESKTVAESEAIQRGPERCCETKGYVEGDGVYTCVEAKGRAGVKGYFKVGSCSRRLHSSLSRADARVKNNCPKAVVKISCERRGEV